jgi:predicted nucleotidyltransferase
MKETLEARRFHYYLNAPENELLRELIEKVSGFYPEIQGVYLYGSKARG